MFTLKAENTYGQRIELTHNEAYVIENVIGLDPPESVINTTRNASAWPPPGAWPTADSSTPAAYSSTWSRPRAGTHLRSPTNGRMKCIDSVTFGCRHSASGWRGAAGMWYTIGTRP